MKHLRKSIALVLIIGLSLAIFAGCTKKTSDVKIVRIGGIANPPGEALTVAIRQGYLDEELAKAGYTYELSIFAQAGPALNEAIATKAIDFGVYAEFPQLVLMDRNINVRAITPINTNVVYAVIAGENSGIRAPKDLEGKDVIVGKGTILQKVFDDVVNMYGLDVDTINQVNAITDRISVYTSGRADAVFSTISSVLTLQNLAGGNIVFSTQTQPEWSSTALIIGRGEYLDENPEAAKAIVRAIYRAYQYANQNPDAIPEIMQTDMLPAELLKEIYAYTPDYAVFKPEFSEAAIARIDGVNTFLAEQGLISKKVNLTHFIDSQYIDAVKSEFER